MRRRRRAPPPCGAGSPWRSARPARRPAPAPPRRSPRCARRGEELVDGDDQGAEVGAQLLRGESGSPPGRRPSWARSAPCCTRGGRRPGTRGRPLRSPGRGSPRAGRDGLALDVLVDLLLPVHQAVEAVLVLLHEVAGVEPSSASKPGSSAGLEVPLHHVGPAHQQLAVGGQAQLDPGERAAQGVVAVAAGGVMVIPPVASVMPKPESSSTP